MSTLTSDVPRQSSSVLTAIHEIRGYRFLLVRVRVCGRVDESFVTAKIA